MTEWGSYECGHARALMVKVWSHKKIGREGILYDHIARVCRAHVPPSRRRSRRAWRHTERARRAQFRSSQRHSRRALRCLRNAVRHRNSAAEKAVVVTKEGAAEEAEYNEVLYDIVPNMYETRTWRGELCVSVTLATINKTCDVVLADEGPFSREKVFSSELFGPRCCSSTNRSGSTTTRTPSKTWITLRARCACSRATGKLWLRRAG